MTHLARYALPALLPCLLAALPLRDGKAATTSPETFSPETAQVNREIEAYAKEYMHFLSVAKTERLAYAEAVRRLDAAGTKVIAVAMNTPRCLNGLPDTVWQVSAWQYDAFSTDAVIRMLKK